MGKKWPVLLVSAMLEDKVEVGEEPGRCVGLTRTLVLSNVEFSRWLEAGSGIPLDQRGVWQKTGRS
jgi:hypothetical protein